MRDDEIFTAAEKAKLFGGQSAPNEERGPSQPSPSAYELTQELTQELARMVAGPKADQYGMPGDEYAAASAAEVCGLPAWVGQVIRMQEKIRRSAYLVKRITQNQYVPTEADLTQIDEDFFDMGGISVIGRLNLRLR